MPLKPLELKIEVNDTQADKDVDSFARDTGQKLDKLRLIELRANTDNLDLKLFKLREELKRIKAEGKEGILDETAFKRVSSEIRKTSSELTEAKRRIQNLKNTGDEATSRLQAKFNALGDGARALGQQLIAVFSFREIIRGLNELSDTFNEFESAFAGFRKTLDASEDTFKKIEEGIVNLSKRIPSTTKELSAIAEVGGQMGIAADDILVFTETVAKLSTAISGVDAETASQQLARVLALSGESIQNIDELGSSLVELGNNFKANEGEILNFAERIAGTGGIVGLTSSEILGISAAFVDVGIQAEAGGTAVQKALLTINGATIDGGEALQGFADTAGLSATEFRQLWETDAAQAFNLFVNGLGEAGDNAKGILDELIGTDVRLQRAFLSLANSGDVLTDAISSANEEFSNANALQDEFSKRLKTTDSQLAIQANRWDAWKASIGGSVSNVRLLVGEFALVFIPNAFASVQFGFAKLVNTFNSGVTSLIGIFGGIGIVIRGVFSEISGVFFNLGQNVSILVNNIGASFDSLGAAISPGINKAIDSIEKFLNFGIDGINRFAKALGFDGVFNRIDLGQVDFGGSQRQTREFVKLSEGRIKQSVQEASSFIKQKAREVEIQDAALELTAQRLLKQSKITQESSTINQAIAKEEGEILKGLLDENLEDFEDIEAEKTGSAGKGAKEREEIANEELESLKDTAKETYNSIQDAREDNNNQIEEEQEKINDLKKEYDELKNDAVESIRGIKNELKTLNEDEDNKLAERRLEILEEQKEAQKEIAELQNELSTDENLEKINALKLQETELAKELALINENVTADVLQQVEAYDKLNETQKILADNAEKRKQIEEELLLQQAIADGRQFDITTNLDDEGNLKAFVKDSQGAITEITDFENIERANKLLKEAEARKQEVLLLRDSIQQKQNLELELVNQLRFIESNYTSFITSEWKQRTQAMQDYSSATIKEIARLKAAADAANISIPSVSSSSSQSAGTTTNNITNNIEVNNATAGAAVASTDTLINNITSI